MEAARSVLRVYSQRKRNRVQRYSPRREGEADVLRRLRARHELARAPSRPGSAALPRSRVGLGLCPGDGGCSSAFSMSISYCAAPLAFVDTHMRVLFDALREFMNTCLR